MYLSGKDMNLKSKKVLITGSDGFIWSHLMGQLLNEGCEKILGASTSKVYGTVQYVPINEKHPRQGPSP